MTACSLAAWLTAAVLCACLVEIGIMLWWTFDKWRRQPPLDGH